MYINIINDWIIQAEFNNPKEASAGSGTIDIFILLDGRVIFPE
jgi:hypothetical protein